MYSTYGNTRRPLRSFKILSMRKALPWALFFLSSCSLERELPSVCITEEKKLLKQMCAEFRKASNTEAAQTIVLNRYGFNDKDSKEILFQVSKSRFTCENAIVRQCDLITLRNGVGY